MLIYTLKRDMTLHGLYLSLKTPEFQCSNYVSDALVQMEKAMKRDKIETNDRQLACAHIGSPEGQDYLKSMAAAANFAWVNRSSMTFLSRQVVMKCPVL